MAVGTDDMHREAPARRFLLIWLGPLSGLLLLSACLSLALDPSWVFGTSLLDVGELRLNDSRAAKAERIIDGTFDTVVFGSSRVHLGIDPKSSAFMGDRVYNAGLPASQLSDILDLIELALEQPERPRRIVLLLQRDLFTHMAAADARGQRSRLAPGRDPVEHYLDHLLSYGSVVDAFTVLQRFWDQKEATPPTRGEIRTDSLGMGHLSRPRATLRERFEHKLGRERDLHPLRGPLAPDFERLARALQALCAGGGEVRMAIAPVHALQLSLWFELEGQEPYQEMLTRLTATVASQGAGCAQLWDFSGFSGIPARTLPAPGPADSSPLGQAYLESSHFKPAVGDLMLQAMLGQGGDPNLPGVLLRPETVGAHIASLMEAHAHYRESSADYALLQPAHASAQP